MRVTQEADYAIRICLILDKLGEKTGAAVIADQACITPKICLKVLRKLNSAEIVRSYKGVQGGYELARDGNELTVLNIVEAIDGPIKISKCLECDYECSRNEKKICCRMHLAFGAINKNLAKDMNRVTVRMLHDESIGASDISNIINN